MMLLRFTNLKYFQSLEAVDGESKTQFQMI